MSIKTVVCNIETMFILRNQGTKHPEAGHWHTCTQIHTVVIGNPRNYQKSVQTYQRVKAS